MKELIIRELIVVYQKLLIYMQNAEHAQTQSSQKLFTTAVTALGKNWCKNHALGCAETVNNIYAKAFGAPIGGGASTYLMYQALKKGDRFLRVATPLAGDIVISPSGYGRLPNGHVGIVGEGEYIMSNDSPTGLFKRNYTFDSWDARYKIKGQFPVEFFRPI